MKRIYENLLRKLTVEDIVEMRKMKFNGVEPRELASIFGVHVTTVNWHCGDINKESYLKYCE